MFWILSCDTPIWWRTCNTASRCSSTLGELESRTCCNINKQQSFSWFTRIELLISVTIKGREEQSFALMLRKRHFQVKSITQGIRPHRKSQLETITQTSGNKNQNFKSYHKEVCLNNFFQGCFKCLDQLKGQTENALRTKNQAHTDQTYIETS